MNRVEINEVGKQLVVRQDSTLINILVIGNTLPEALIQQARQDERIGGVDLITPEAIETIRDIIYLASTGIVVDTVGLALPWSIAENLDAYHIDLLELLDPNRTISPYRWETMMAQEILHRERRALEIWERECARQLLDTFRTNPLLDNGEEIAA